MNEQRDLEVHLRVAEFDRLMTERGLTSDLARARHLGVSHTTIRRLRDGNAAGSRFIAHALDALEVPFEHLFERTEVA